MEILMADFFNFLRLLKNFYFCKRDWVLGYACPQLEISLNFLIFKDPKS